MTDLPRVLLLGDSIRMSYQPDVAALLGADAEVVGPPENGQFTAHTRAMLERWLADLGTPNVVHWNNGLHDVGHNPARTPVQYDLETYIANLKAILARLRATGATIIFATSTPVHAQRPFTTDDWAWRNDEIDAFNAAAVDLMQRAGVPVNDLHGVIAADVDRYLADDMLHLSDAGRQACARAAAAAVREYGLREPAGA
jgi:lysophospholipase L1-like esterase